MRDLILSAIRDESGATSIEYALVASLIAMAVIGAVRAVGATTLTNLYVVIGDAMTSASGN